MRAKEYLNQVRMLDRKIAHKREEVEALRARAESTSSGLSGSGRVQSTPEADKTGRIVTRIVDLEREIEDTLEKLCVKRDEVINTIHMLEDHRYVELLYLKYVKYMRLEEIACTMKRTDGRPYSFQHILRLHGEALRAVEVHTERFSK